MKTINGILKRRIGLLWVLLFALAAPSAMAEEAYLRAMPFSQDVLDGSGGGSGTTSVPMWGYALCTGTGGVIDSGSCGAPTSPGPTIEVTEGQNLTIYVDNQLPVLANVLTETSVLIPALPKPLAPVRFPVTGDPSRDNRIYSFDAVTANGATGMYEWTAPRPGTFLYHSGTHPQVQVQMGLFGAVVVRANTSADCTALPCAYSDVPYDEEAVVIFSEIDAALHEAVANDTYGTPAGPTSTELYVPRFFLLNGKAFPDASLDPLVTAGVNNNLLLRLVNAGLEEYSPQLLGSYFEVLAEDGHRAPTSREQLALILPAGKSKDILLRSDAIGTLTLFERGLHTVNDSGGNGGMFARIGVTNTAPIADAGPDQNVDTGTLVQLDGSGSSDPNGDPLTYSWQLTSVPGGSTATLSDGSLVNPTFTADVDGDYVAELIVNDGLVDSVADTVTVSASPPAPNNPPTADAGPDQGVAKSDLVQLDGSGSSDLDGDPLTYSWQITVSPAGSTATLSDATLVNPTFTADLAGLYTVQLIVNDGQDDSVADTVDITATNTAPVADAGPDQNVSTTDLVQLDGSGSMDANGDALSYSWQLTALPGGSSATLSDATIVNPTFTADLAGTYTAQLIVNDGTDSSIADTVDIIATDVPVNTPPTANAGPDQNVVKSALVQLDGSGSSDGDGDPLTYSWQLTTVPAGSTATLSNPTLVNPTFTADLAGVYIAQLIANDGFDDSIADLVSITATNTAPVANAGGDMNAVVGNPVQLDGSGSSDANGDSLTYAWWLSTVPAGSTATISDASLVNPTFVPDLEGIYIVSLIVNDGTDDSPIDTATTTAIAGGGGTGPFEQTGGILSMEAEHFATNTAAGGVAEWIVLDPVGDASNTMAIKSAGGAQTYTAGTGSTTTYEAQLDAGTHYVWARFRSFSSSTDSFFFQFDGGGIQTRGVNPDDGQWHWIELASPVTVGTADVYTMTVYRRERDLELDKLVITTDNAFNPASVNGGLGPDESPRVGGGVNTPPMTDAGPNQNVKTGDLVTLDGSNSSDPDGDPLTYNWTLMSAPAGSAASLSSSSSVNPTFTADLDGSYVIQLIVNDGSVNGLADTVTITAAPNTAPVANAGPDQTVAVSDLVQLDGSGSSDGDGDSITYSWQLTAVPAGSSATLSNATAVNPTFTADMIGSYTAQLVVNDGLDDSIADEVVITAENTAPVANAGPDQTVGVSDAVQLDGSGSSDANGDPLTYSWSLTGVPAGSTATLNDATLVNPQFTADLAGDYIAQLIVNDGTTDSIADTVTITANVGGGTGPFVQTGGIASIEAENFLTNMAASGVAEWLVIDPSAGASSAVAIKAAGGAQTYTQGAGPFTTYEVQTDAATQYVWVRARSFSGTTDSLYFQLNGGAIQNRGLNPDDGQWRWIALASTVSGTGGVDTITIYRRERDVEIDKVVMTTDPSFDPASVNGGLGPDESPRL